jgi:hypothetical protein
VVLAAGDNNARDIDLFVLDGEGNIAVKDVAPDPTPVADIQVKGDISAGVRFQNVDSQGPALVLAAVLRVENDWRPGQSMRESMIRLLAPATQVIDATKFGFWETA